MPTSDLPPGKFAMPDHGLFVSSIVHAIAPDVELHLVRVLNDFGLASEAHRKVIDLSGGFRRRVQVAKVFMVDTPVVFLEEIKTRIDKIKKSHVNE